MTRSALPPRFALFFALAMAMVRPSAAGSRFGADPGTGSPLITEVNCSPSSGVSRNLVAGGPTVHYAIPGNCQVRRSDGATFTVKYYVDGNWTPGPKGYATETGRIYGLGTIAPDMFQPAPPGQPDVDYTVFVDRLFCDADPWLNDARCGLENFTAPDELTTIFPSNMWRGPFPLTKGALTPAQRRAWAPGSPSTKFLGDSLALKQSLTPPPRPNPYGATYKPGPIPTLNRGQTTTVKVQVTNTRSLTWTPSGPNPFNLSYHWYQANSVPPGTAPAGAVVWDGPRFLVPQTVGTNQSVTITARVTAPSTTGTYVLKWDMAHEGVAWFSGKGVPTGDQTVAVK